MRTLPIALLVTLLGACGGGGGNAVAPPASSTPPPAPQAPAAPPRILPRVTAAWHAPSCGSVSGAAPVTFTRDGGANRATIQTPAASNYFTYGVVALEGGSTLAAIVGTTTTGNDAQLYFSADAGCSWQPSGQTFTDVFHFLDAALAPAGTHAYAWSTNHQSIHVIAPTGIMTPLSLASFPSWVSGPYGIGIDPSNPQRVRIASYDCQHRASCGIGSVIEETTNGGTTWTRLGVPAPYGALRFDFSPINLDHAIALSITPAAHVTLDGGNQWIAGHGVPASWSAEDIAIGADGQTVWLLVGEDQPAAAAALFVSHDGGLNYQEAFASSTENPFFSPTPLTNQLHRARIFADPSDADVVYLAHTSEGEGKSYLYRYDAEFDQLSRSEWPAAEGAVWSIAFNPADSEVLYLGLAAVR